MPLPAHHHALLERRDEIRHALAHIGDLRPGSLKSRYRKCGKSNCHCAREGDPGHGPQWSLSRLVKGKMHSRAIPVHALEDTQRQVEECHRLRELTKELIEVSDQICDAQLHAHRPTPSKKKTTSPPSSPRNSPPKSNT